MSIDSAQPDRARGTVVVGVDGSRGVHNAVDWAADEAKRRGWRLEVLYAWHWPRGGASAASLGRVYREVCEAVDAAVRQVRGRHPGLAAEPRIEHGHARQVLAAATGPDRLLVLGGGGTRLRQLLPGSLVRTVLADAEGPVLVVRPDRFGRPPWPWQRHFAGADDILVGVSHEDCRAAVREAFREAALRHQVVHAVFAWPVLEAFQFETPYTGGLRETALDDSKAALARAVDPALAGFSDVPVRAEIIEGSGAHVLLREARHASLVVVAVPSHRGPFRLRVGRVAGALLRRAHTPVLLVPRGLGPTEPGCA